MIWFFRDFLDGFTYLGFSIVCIIFIMAIIGFMMERKQLEREKKNREAVLEGDLKSSALGSVPLTDASTSASNIYENNVSSRNEHNVEIVQPQSVIPEEVKAENAATNAIPEVLDLNVVEDNNR